MVAWKRETETYTTSDWHPSGDRPPTDPVVALYQLPKGPVYELDDYRDSYGPKRWISIGISCLSDIQPFEKLEPGKRHSVSRDHCGIWRTPQGHVFVEPHESSKNSTKVNRARIHRGRAELQPGHVLRLGRIELVAIGAAGLTTIKITADDPAEYLERLIAARGNVRDAASFLGISYSRFRRWLTKLRN